MKQLTIYPYEPIDIDVGITCICSGQAQWVWQLARWFINSDDHFAVLSEGGSILNENAVMYVGDVINNPNFEKYYTKQLIKIIQKHIDSDTLAKLYELDMAIRNMVRNVIFENDLPIDVKNDWHLDLLLKYLGIRVEMPVINSTCDIIVSVIDFANRLNDDRVFIFSNVRSLLSDEEVIQLAREAKLKHVSILLLDKASSGRKNMLMSNDINSVYIDQDFVDFRSNEP